MTGFPKPGIVRLVGKARQELREECFRRARGRCTKCGRLLQPGWHMAHIRNRRMFGDVISNVRARCADCHLVGDHNPKSVPPKHGGTHEQHSAGNR